MPKNIVKVRGTKDILPEESFKWQKIEKLFFEISLKYGFREIRVPTFEYTEVFTRGIGDNTDVIDKEMYTFFDKGNRSLTLKPEGTAGVVRSVIESGIINNGFPLKLCYSTPCFRYDKPQAGRLREFHQFGLELFGSVDSLSDIEVISIAKEVIDRVNITSYDLEINSIGCDVCRPPYSQELKAFLKDKTEGLCIDCKTRLIENPLRVFDCKVESCKQIVEDAPKILNHLCNGCEQHFESLKQNLENFEIKYKLNPDIVRGLDYYTKTVFEFTTSSLGSQSTICGGGRYDGLVKLMGGKDTPAVGFGMGIERVLMLIDKDTEISKDDCEVEIYIANITKDDMKLASYIVKQLRSEGVKTECDLMQRSIKAQMKYADKLNALYVAVIGEDEIKQNSVNIKNMSTGEIIQSKICDIGKVIKSRRKTNVK